MTVTGRGGDGLSRAADAGANGYAELILAAATRLFLRLGAARVGMRDIAREAGVAVGTLYNYYQDKADLARAVQNQAADELIRRLRLERLNPGRPLDVKLQALAQAALDVAPLFSDPTQLVELLTPAFAWALEEAEIRGELPRSEQVSRLASLLAAVVAGTSAVTPLDAAERAALPLQLARLTCGGLAMLAHDGAAASPATS